VGLALRLFLPAEWTDDPARYLAAGVPEVRRAYRTKRDLALDEIDRVTAADVTTAMPTPMPRRGPPPRAPRAVVPTLSTCGAGRGNFLACPTTSLPPLPRLLLPRSIAPPWSGCWRARRSCSSRAPAATTG